MPFMIGREPVRRTIKYLEAGSLVLKDAIQIFSINYNTHGIASSGIRNFIFWHLPQLMFKNPDVQIVTIKNRTPTPFVWCFYDNGKRMLVDVDSKNKDEILDHLIKVVGKSKEVLKKEAIAKEKKDNPANFGVGCEKNCACIIPGQLPCPAVVPLPFHMRGKTYLNKD
ncbi:probable 28S ribosomal protein S25, mitochondrial [Copidosoma floridanum]|uniref:probable 28S ribosomal protein S25, mitochondrial n=1 Tax=Copidosoma floridanum TaxID=29053 RepID=UPI0006C964C2|nr:probable 28S ribosomal protein S25, mitochondrial [Copidosoma floridanum]